MFNRVLWTCVLRKYK
uniref:Uncharacterized protein n=1 Tax=Arundo donax TaxID=35708 RepID=A0A0A9CQ78_ARUDO